MLFLIYWELNENMPVGERLQIGQKLTSSGLYPPKGVNVIRWDITPDGWGITLVEAENATDVGRSIDMWRASGAGFFKCIKTSPAIPVQEYMPMVGELLKTMGS